MRNRLSNFFATPINAIKDKLHLSLRPRMMKSDSRNSLDELLKFRKDGHVPPDPPLMWDSDVGHHTLAQVSSQSSRLDCLPEENDEHNTVVHSMYHLLHGIVKLTDDQTDA